MNVKKVLKECEYQESILSKIFKNHSLKNLEETRNHKIVSDATSIQEDKISKSINLT